MAYVRLASFASFALAAILLAPLASIAQDAPEGRVILTVGGVLRDTAEWREKDCGERETGDGREPDIGHGDTLC